MAGPHAGAVRALCEARGATRPRLSFAKRQGWGAAYVFAPSDAAAAGGASPANGAKKATYV